MFEILTYATLAEQLAKIFGGNEEDYYEALVDDPDIDLPYSEDEDFNIFED